MLWIGEFRKKEIFTGTLKAENTEYWTSRSAQRRERIWLFLTRQRERAEYLDTVKYPHTEQKYRFELCRDTKDSDLLRLKRHGNTTTLILEFLDLNDNEERIQFLQKHQAEIDSRFLTAASESLEFAENSDTVEERYAALMRFLKTKSRYESRRLR